MASKTEITLPTPVPFNFERTAHSHGWAVLAPNTWNDDKRSLSRSYRLETGRVVLLDVQGDPTQDRIIVQIESVDSLTGEEEREIEAVVTRMLRLDEDLSAFYHICREKGGSWVKLTKGLGRLLRSPNVFEDLVKTICTTNIQWGGTTRMVANFVDVLGEPYPGDPNHRSFPTPESAAQISLEDFTESIRLGYRGPYVHQVAQHVVTRELDLDSWQNPTMPTVELKKALLAVKGVGNYSAATMLMLLGRYDEIAVDTVFRDFVAEKYFDGKRPPDTEAKAVYDEWGKWKYLAYWFDIWQKYDETL